MRFFFFFQENLEQNTYHVGPVYCKNVEYSAPMGTAVNSHTDHESETSPAFLSASEDLAKKNAFHSMN